MADLSAEKTWGTWRKSGLWKAIAFVLATLAFGVADYLTKGIIPGAATAISDVFSPPQFTIVFSSPVDIDTARSTFKAIPRSEQRNLSVTETTNSYIILSGAPGNYHVNLYRSDSRLLPVVLTLKRDENIKIETGDDKWTTPEALKKGIEDVKAPESSVVKGDVLREVRWTVTQADFAQLSAAKTSTTRAILANALQEVGTHEVQNAARVLEYWDSIPLLRDRNGITLKNPGPWGAMFMSWVVSKSGASPPGLGAAYNSWPGWGAGVSPNSAEPGMIALFATKAVPGLTSSYLGGIVLRQRPDCTEIITGNVVDRVVIACVGLPAASVRRPV